MESWVIYLGSDVIFVGFLVEIFGDRRNEDLKRGRIEMFCI